ncbi:hypothetical protein COX22_03770 [Candidatus Falkowbacteria bacterium CG23_combo_of_CG06-09_8_20_14_all_49_15]|uniref:DUF4878 domain-containing protein n=1 Tax=Candidatus Falkowbacteria bacterium CG23_combo_of_CG06-09_8_20_14_all_49_15 TaxID=1974572 RepID=A0A2G9ZK63_9BACT|nr:MAG: hypothetical protein COX22_03770 [Candidatus Falkowbacteria bacterium CG23_combo_of_CG06-09_8_20_14_all_49_15]
MKKYLLPILIIAAMLGFSREPAGAADSLAQKLAGRILLQVENQGEAWYVNPADQKRYFLARPDDAFALMSRFGIGITDDNLKKIAVGLLEDDDEDSDQDGLSDRWEEAFGTDPRDQDSDHDGYDDRLEIQNAYDPLSRGHPPLDDDFSAKQAGKIFLQTEKKGEAWYVCPVNHRRYFLGRPADAWRLMQKLGLGASNENLAALPIGFLSPPAPIKPPTGQKCSANSGARGIFACAAEAIRRGQKEQAKSYFTPAMGPALEYTMDFLDAEGKFALGNIMAGAQADESTADKVVFTTEVYFSLGGYKVPVRFNVIKQDDGSWKVGNL